MNWDFAIERYRGPLLSRILTLCAEIGLTEGAVVERISKPLYRKVLGVLRAAESAVRRLIYVAARDIVVEPKPKRPVRAERKNSGEIKDKGKADGEDKPKVKRKRRWLFRLFDPPKRENRAYGRPPRKKQAEPRIHFFGYDPRIPEFLRGQSQPAPPAPVIEERATVDDGTVSAANLCRRLFAIVDALQDIPLQAMRLALWRARPPEERRPPRESPIRFGRPPGFRQRPKHEVDEILKECHWLARNVQPRLDDTS
jgi:hypothetical protein